MFEYLLTGVSFGALLVYGYTKSKAPSDTLTLKSGSPPKKVTTFHDLRPQGYDNRVAPIAPSSTATSKSSKDEYQLPDTIDMKNICYIELESNCDLQIFDDYITVPDYAIVEVLNSTLIIKSKSQNQGIVVVSGNGNISVGSNIRATGNVSINGISVSGRNVSIGNIATGQTSEIKKISLFNFNTKNLSRVSINGSGDIEMNNLRCNESTRIIIEGSGDVNVHSCQFENLVVSIKGSGDVKLDRDCTAYALDLSIAGSGDIISKIPTISTVNRTIRGSGDIKLASDKKSKDLVN